MGRYKVLEAIGEGSFGKVFRGECKETEQIVALKFIPKHMKGDNELISLRRECEIQRGLFHPNIVLMLDSFETEREIVAVSEYVPQQLCALLQANGPMTETVACSITCNLVSALYYLHSHRIVHRDIKPQNILLTESGTAKLCDFGFSKKMEINTYVLESIKGTPLYMAPELIEQQPYDQRADLWSLGCILFELLTGRPPFCTNSIVHLIEMVRTKPVNWPSGCSSDCISFLQGLLQKDQEKRLEWPSVLQHPWVANGITVVPHNPMVATLTSPLTHSQQQVKEHQKQQLVLRNLGQPNLLPKAIAIQIFNTTRVVPDLEIGTHDLSDDILAIETLQRPPVAVDFPTNICNSLEKMSLSNGTAATGTATFDEQPHLSDIKLGQRDTQADSNVINVRESVQINKTVDNSAGNIESNHHNYNATTGNRKNSISNYLTNSYCSSRRSSRPSNAMLDEMTEEQSNNIDKNLPYAIHSLKNIIDVESEQKDLAAEESEIQEEEWCHFLDQTIADVMAGNFDVYTQPGELAMFVSPLRNLSCPLPVLEKIAVLFMLPFVLKVGDEILSEICLSYLRYKVVCNLIFACKHVEKKSGTGVDETDMKKEQISALNQMLMVICHLIYLDSASGSSFLNQFCEGISVLECHKILGYALLCPSSSSQLLSSILAILTQILRIDDSQSGVDLSNIVLLVIGSAHPGTSSHQKTKPMENSLRFLLMSLLTHTAYLVRSRMCTLLAYLTTHRSCLIQSALAGQHKLLCDLINLENDPSREVCRAASFALARLQQHTVLLKQPV